jgi:NADP-dependent 3-hydroxy acid dehydrogenase YdfG
MTDHVTGKSIVITGAGGGFGRLVALKTAARGAKVTLGDIDLAAAEAVASEIRTNGGAAQAVAVDVTKLAETKALVGKAIEAFGRIDVMINNAGIMPLAFISDHEAAYEAWGRCIDVNIKGVLNGMIAAHDPMIAAGRGHVINLSSIYGNFPVTGAAVYGASKSAVNFLSESFRVEARGKIKVTIVKPTGVPATGLSGTIINPAAAVGIVAQNALEFGEMAAGIEAGTFPARTARSGQHRLCQP